MDYLLLFFAAPFVFLFGYAIKTAIKNKKKSHQIKIIYETNHTALRFIHQRDKDLFENCLIDAEIPENWYVSVINNQISGISYNDGKSVGAIAYRKDAFNSTIRRFAEQR